MVKKLQDVLTFNRVKCFPNVELEQKRCLFPPVKPTSIVTNVKLSCMLLVLIVTSSRGMIGTPTNITRTSVSELVVFCFKP